MEGRKEERADKTQQENRGKKREGNGKKRQMKGKKEEGKEAENKTKGRENSENDGTEEVEFIDKEAR